MKRAGKKQSAGAKNEPSIPKAAAASRKGSDSAKDKKDDKIKRSNSDLNSSKLKGRASAINEV